MDRPLELTAAVMGTNICGVLIFEWILKFRIWVLTVMIGTCVYGVLVIYEYVCFRVYGIYIYI